MRGSEGQQIKAFRKLTRGTGYKGNEKRHREGNAVRLLRSVFEGQTCSAGNLSGSELRRRKIAAEAKVDWSGGGKMMTRLDVAVRAGWSRKAGDQRLGAECPGKDAALGWRELKHALFLTKQSGLKEVMLRWCHTEGASRGISAWRMLGRAVLYAGSGALMVLMCRRLLGEDRAMTADSQRTLG